MPHLGSSPDQRDYSPGNKQKTNKGCWHYVGIAIIGIMITRFVFSNLPQPGSIPLDMIYHTATDRAREVHVQSSPTVVITTDPNLEAIRINPKNAESYLYRGKAYYALGDMEQAIADLTQAVILRMNLTEAYYYLGLSYAGQGERDDALDYFAQALAYDPEYVSAYEGRGNTYYDLGDYAHATADYREYERITGRLEPFMQKRIKEMEAVLTPAP